MVDPWRYPLHRLMLALALTASLLVPWSVPAANAAEWGCPNNPPRIQPGISVANEPGGVRVVIDGKGQVIHSIDFNYGLLVNAQPQPPTYTSSGANFFVRIPNGGAAWMVRFNGCAGSPGGHWYTFVGHG